MHILRTSFICAAITLLSIQPTLAESVAVQPHNFGGLKEMLSCVANFEKNSDVFNPEIVATTCIKCDLQDGPAASPPGVCDGPCDPGPAPDNKKMVCVPKIGDAARPQKTPGKFCECVFEAEEKCESSTAVTGGRVVFRWAYPNGQYCKYGKCDGGKTCQSKTQANGDPGCGCS